ncbi:hypothetical protein VNI00_016158 [Paramarasmius palmivorus]|uniref:CxC2-like cysteine cluster KDZ transposase-associated domain-containing protein n=1 Tax=Paramarasmius palmivorus TaxID=297713 RepID=A0AAW0BD25_9AGAR
MSTKRKRKAPQLRTHVRQDLDSPAPFFDVVSLSSDGLRGTRNRVPLALSPPKKKTRLDSTTRIDGNEGWEDFGSFSGIEESSWEMGDTEEVVEEDREQLKSELKESVKRNHASDHPMKEWVPQASLFLDELMRLESRHGAPVRCFRCKTSEVDLYRCKDCSEKRLSCAECIVFDHRRRPFDRIEKWNGRYFERVTLKSLGLFVQLGHPPGEKCNMHNRGSDSFVVVDLNSIQEVEIRYCMCQRDVGKEWQQLMRYELYPATVNEPRTAFTFQTLSLFHTMTHQGKITLYDFYYGLEARTDGAGLGGLKDRYEAFVRVVRQWRYLKMLKRGGIGNVPSATRDLSRIPRGSLSLRCLACPRPGVNIPNDWRKASPDKRRHISSEEKDPGLWTGSAYYVPQEQYQKFVKVLTEQKETSSCTGLQAVKQANSKFSKSYATTGVLLCLCIRHEMVEPNGTVDLNKGEKFGHADYAISASQSLDDPHLKRVLSYDIVCQYYVKFFGRMEWIPDPLKMVIIAELWRFVVPKLHIQGHERKCQENFSLHLCPGTGQTDGEGVERHWASDGPIATSTREMGPGHRRDTIDDHFGSSNHRKRIGIGRLLHKRRREAASRVKVHSREFELFTSNQDASSIEEWRRIVLDWESGASKKNPYSLPQTGETEHDVRLHYAKKEAQELKQGMSAALDISASAFIYLALEVEELQRRLVAYIKENKANTTLQQTDLADRRAKLERAIARVRRLQEVYTPIITTLDGVQESAPEPETVNLLLPSGLPDEVRRQPVMEKWVAMEAEYRRGQCESSLDDIRTRLFVRTKLLTNRDLNARHQKGARDAREVLARNNHKMEEAKDKYRAAYTALMSLRNGTLQNREKKFQELRDADVRSLDEEDTHAMKNVRKALGKERLAAERNSLIQAGESRRTTTWIWRDVDVSGDPEIVKEVVRVEWSKAWARKRRWEEEELLVEEEMRRVIETLAFEAGEWRERLVEGESSVEEGMKAYAERQAVLREQLASRFRRIWSAPERQRPVQHREQLLQPAELESDSGEEDSADEEE